MDRRGRVPADIDMAELWRGTADCVGITREFCDGGSGRHDVAVGADGIRSSLRESVDPAAGARFLGQVCRRSLTDDTPDIAGGACGWARGRPLAGYPVSGGPDADSPPTTAGGASAGGAPRVVSPRQARRHASGSPGCGVRVPSTVTRGPERCATTTIKSPARQRCGCARVLPGRTRIASLAYGGAGAEASFSAPRP
jgi:hypothetical protein